MGCKMSEYRERFNEWAAAPKEDPSSSVKSGDTDTELPQFMSLARKYGFDDGDDEMDIGHVEATARSVDQEYQSYITSPLSPKKTDIVKFWEASNRTSLL